MKIGILTQPLASNYGGILQNYALQTVLIRLGHNPYTIYYGQNRVIDWLNIWIRYIVKLIIRHPNRKIKPLGYTKYINKCNCPHITDFVKHHINTTYHIGQHINNSKLASYKFDAYIVGSDQTWRPQYNLGHQLYNMFLDFIQKEHYIKRIAYAASFGVDKWEYNNIQTQQCSELIKLFDAVSVREESGIKLCKKYFNAAAIHLLDPTLLLSADDYRLLINNSDTPNPDGDVLVYILDLTDEKKSLVNNFCTKNNYNPFYVGVKNLDGTHPSIESWLNGFNTAKYVITDSFHGSVFSIIFNKPFVSIGNDSRGMSRFNSLLSIFNLEDRLVSASTIVDTIPIPDWEKVNAIKEQWQTKSIKFLVDNLR